MRSYIVEKIEDKNIIVVDVNESIYLREHKEITRNECMELLNLTRDIAIRELLSLKRKGIIKQIGKGKNIYYVLV
ncbi:MAG: hypothetical protein ABII74_05470 [Elusimicrobiota bacterium]